MAGEDEAPSWLTASAPTPAPAPVPAPSPAKAKSTPAAAANTPAASLPSTAVATGTADMDPVTLAAIEREQLKGIVLFTRIINFAVSVAVITISILNFISLASIFDIKIMVLSVYSTCGGYLICCLETQLKFIRTGIAMNFGFLFNAGFRLFFYLLVGSICCSFGDIFSFIVGGCMFAVGIYNTYVLIKYPAYRNLRDELAKEEDQRIEGKMREKAKAEATKQMFSRGGNQ